MALITSPNNRYVKLARSLQDRSWREKKGLYLIEGIHLLEEALQAGTSLEVVLHSPRIFTTSRGEKLVAGLQRAGYQCLAVTEELMAGISTTMTPPGIVAVAPMQAKNLAELLAVTSPLHSPPLFIIAAGIQDPGNLGTIWRTALGAGATGLILTRGCVDPYNPKVVRSAMGATFRLPVAGGVEPALLARKLQDAGLKLVVADVGAPLTLWQVDLRPPLALIVGSENHGPGPELLAAATERVGIPLVGPVDSLNAAVAAALLLYEALRQRQGV
ncbi:TrmH family RNA methyltransferase [Neomoorella thermoacetica]|uniref:23S rRNA (Uridine(2479)-2'-O)-methyltransferase n=3 Tax=Neomoorella thermoacetica TaxID=1525 RepID=A0A1D7XC65_NEOTH|nr:RNA methyltransferase [Moorella thermoacetica]AKX94559.1 23S rRNA (uridine(2479)-2'-O)-methyltransferase [Moorella thermoacetica]AKX97195.1 23S rRNA (uridine(2479)-2'-O)-methyltransferase [Moorella thermoacetica]AOQ24500.1 23S rRNA (uridine(2479)-2'-O)-methyltransferase [Moorella thermoacetica]OIQ11864.1 23S rRNA (uridine(2479)-2'-O)-methyltransferase [Moorella thermoacetica]OIQ55100.1 23S rRNA (uridine(2479)-2'-O)-methyltransferase [Moorella thermoacetica]